MSYTSIFADRGEMEAALRAMVTQAARWHNMTTGAYASGYYAGYIDAIKNMADTISVDAGIDDRIVLEAE